MGRMSYNRYMLQSKTKWMNIECLEYQYNS